MWGNNKATTLDGFEGLHKLEYLVLEHIPSVRSLEPLSQLLTLKTLVIHSAVYYDISGKFLNFDTFEPLGHLKCLLYIELIGVKPNDLSFNPLANLTNLKALKLSHNILPPEEYGRLARALPNTTGDFQHPYVVTTAEVFRCNKCFEQKVMLIGKSRPQFICPHCDQRKVDKHIARYNSQ